MAARKTPPPRKPTTKPKNKPLSGPNVDYAKTALTASYGSGQVDASMQAVLDYYASGTRKEQRQRYQTLASTIKNRDLTNWSGDPGQIALFGEIDAGARLAYAKLDPRRNGTLAAGTAAAAATAAEPTMFSTGVSGADQTFIREAGQSKFAAGEAEGGATRNKKKKQRKKLVKRVTKKTNVKGKAVRKALRSPGITASDKKVYAKVAKQATPKLSSRLRVADRRKAK